MKIFRNKFNDLDEESKITILEKALKLKKKIKKDIYECIAIVLGYSNTKK